MGKAVTLLLGIGLFAVSTAPAEAGHQAAPALSPAVAPLAVNLLPAEAAGEHLLAGCPGGRGYYRGGYGYRGGVDYRLRYGVGYGVGYRGYGGYGGYGGRGPGWGPTYYGRSPYRGYGRSGFGLYINF